MTTKRSGRIAVPSRRVLLGTLGAALADIAAAEAELLAIVTRTQDGFAGTVGTRTTLRADGRFRVERFVGERILETREGRLSAEAITAARAAIDAAGLAALPPQAGQPPPVNPQRLTIEAAGISRSIAGSAAGSGDSHNAPAGTLAELARRIEQLTQP